jgi:hypothetical protein
MNAKQVLDRIVKTLSLSKEEVLFTYAKLADGTILESPTFDLGEKVEVVSEDGTKTLAPNGEHEVVLKDSEGNDVRIKVETKDGIITERENVEVETPAADEAVEMESIAGGDMGDDEEVDTEETANPIPEDSDKEDMGKMIQKMQYRIEELEKKMQSMMEVKEDLVEDGKKAEKVKTEDLPGDPTKVNTVDKMAAVEPDEEEEELPKLDGAPIDENAPNKTGIKMNKKGALVNTQNSFLSKLYK